MKITRTGIILNTQKYQECIEFYDNILGLEVLHKIDRDNEKITTFLFGDTYLMVETGGNSYDGVKPIYTCPTKFRFNVSNVQVECNKLQSKGVQIEVIHHEWGTTAEFSDPDGNRCALRSDEGFGC